MTDDNKHRIMKLAYDRGLHRETAHLITMIEIASLVETKSSALKDVWNGEVRARLVVDLVQAMATLHLAATKNA